MSRTPLMIIPAAGLGTRLGSAVPKPLVAVNGKAMVDHLIDLYAAVVGQFILVLHPSFESAVKEHGESKGLRAAYVCQHAPTGMLDGVLAPLAHVRAADPERVWITWCDQVAVHPGTIATLSRLSEENPRTPLVFPTAQRHNPYIHLLREASGRIVDIRHRREGDAMPESGESDLGLFSLSPETYLDRLTEFAREAASGAATHERNFLPFIPWLARRGGDLLTFPCRDAREAIGVNTPDELRQVERYLLERDGSAGG